jgi:mono/diheme cytochrome c family protein
VFKASGRVAKKVAGFVFSISASIFFLAPLLKGQNHGVSTSVSEKEIIGKRLFYQRCSFCHLGMPTKYQTYAPVLYRELVTELGEDTVREKISDGSITMPAFKYSLNSRDIDDIVEYLKTLRREDVIGVSSNQ